MRLLTFNTLFRGDVRARLSALRPRLASFDVVCLQEVMWRHNAALLARSFPHLSAFGGPILKGGLVMLSRRPITAARFVRYPVARPFRPELIMRKGAQIVVVEGLTIVNTHLSANIARIQRGELAFLAEVLTSVTSPLVVVGDLNVSRPSLAPFLETAGLTDAMAGDRRPTYRPTEEFPDPPAFDHVLTRGVRAEADIVFEEAVELADGREAYLSDHYALAAEISWPPAQ
jgi:endonuclease/exonuclease/phosphatase family metal-dependent hydrolase